MTSLQEAWDTAPAPGTIEQHDKIPAGDHEAKLIKSEVIHTSNGKVMWLLVFGDEHARTVDKWHDLERHESVRYIKADLLTFEYSGVGPVENDWPDLAEWAPTIVGSTVRIRVKYKAGENREFATVYLNELVELVKAEAKPAATAPSDLDDIPFAPSSMDRFL